MIVLVTCKNKEDPINNVGARVVTTLFIDFSDSQGQLTPKSVMVSCQNSVLLPAKMKKTHQTSSPKSNDPHLGAETP